MEKVTTRFFAATFSAWMLASCIAGDGAVGDPCEGKMNCASRSCLTESYRGGQTGWTDGYCTAACNSNADCPAGTCQVLGGQGYCLAACEGDSDCRDGYRCNPVWGACLPHCANAGWSCGAELVCDESGLCVDADAASGGGGSGAGGSGAGGSGAGGSGAGIGAPCKVPADCASGYAIPETDPTGRPTFWTGGYCSQPCSSTLPCPGGSTCETLLDGSFCLATCASDADCRADYVCDTDWLTCVPDCRLGWPCGPSMTCKMDGVCREGAGYHPWSLARSVPGGQLSTAKDFNGPLSRLNSGGRNPEN
jgi:hypothetical protein